MLHFTLFFLGLVSVGQAVTCYVCNSSAACIDHYSPDPAHEVDCGTTEYDDGFCSTLKDITRVSGIRVTAGMFSDQLYSESYYLSLNEPEFPTS